MKKLILLLALSMISTTLSARNTVSSFSIADAMQTSDFKSHLDDSIVFKWGDQPAGKIIKDLGEFKSNKKTNAFARSDETACQRALLDALISLRDRAIKEGGNAVINIKSNYQNNLTSSETTYTCGAGGLMAGVALSGKIVKISK